MSELFSNFGSFRFAAPWVLLALLLIPLWMLLRGRFAPAAAVQFSSSKLLAAASRRTRSGPGRFLFAFRCLALALLIVALARPQVDKGLSERESMGINIMFVLDFSGTMKTRDFMLDNKRISRADAMKRVITEFVSTRDNDRIGAVAFHRGANLISPLTLDHAWLSHQLAAEEPKQGTAPGSGMLIGAEALQAIKTGTKLLITVTDADQVNEGPAIDQVAKAIAPMGIKNYVIHMVDKSLAQRRTASGDILTEATRITGGQFFKVSDYAELKNVYRQIDQLEKSPFKERKQKIWRDVFPWFVAPALLLLLLEVLLGRTVWRRLP